MIGITFLLLAPGYRIEINKEIGLEMIISWEIINQKPEVRHVENYKIKSSVDDAKIYKFTRNKVYAA